MSTTMANDRLSTAADVDSKRSLWAMASLYVYVCVSVCVCAPLLCAVKHATFLFLLGGIIQQLAAMRERRNIDAH